MNRTAWYLRQARLTSVALTSLLVISAAFATACGSSKSSSHAASSSTASTTGPASYSGVEQSLPIGFAAPQVNSNRSLTMGYLQIYAALPILQNEQKGAAAEAQKLGVRMIAKDASLNPQTQVSQFDQLLAQHVDAIVVYPVVPQSLTPELAKAKAAGVPVISTNARPDVTQPLPPGYVADVEQELDREAYTIAKVGAGGAPGGNFGIMGIGPPVQAIKYLDARMKYWGQQFGLKFVGEVDAPQDVPSAYGPACTQLLSKASNIQEIFTYNDPAALTCSTVARSSGHPDVKILAGSGTGEPVIQAIKAGRVYMSYAWPWAQTGAEMMIGAYNAATKQHLPLPKTVGILGTAITKQNAETVKPTG